MSKLFTMAVPVLHGKEAEFQKFIKELKDNRYEDFLASRRSFAVRERVFYQQTSRGGLVVVVLEGEDPETAFRNFGHGTDGFTQWFISQVKEIHGIDLSAPPVVPLPYMIIDSGPLTERIITHI